MAAEAKRKNYTIYILVGLLIVAAFFIGSLYTRVKTMEKGQTVGQQTAAPTSIPIPTLKPLTVSNDDPSLGPKDAKVTAVIFADYQCPYCGAFSGLNQEVIQYMQETSKSRGSEIWEPTEQNLIKDYVKTGKVRLVFKDYPFLDARSETKESHWAATAAWCAGDQGKFWEYHDYLFSHQKGENEGTFSKDNLKKFAAALGLKTADFNTCLDSGKYEKKVADATIFSQSVGVDGTPAFFVNGKVIPGGTVSYSQVKAVIEAELKK